MNVVYDTVALPEVGALTRGVNPTTDSDRMKAPVDWRRLHEYFFLWGEGGGLNH